MINSLELWKCYTSEEQECLKNSGEEIIQVVVMPDRVSQLLNSIIMVVTVIEFPIGLIMLWLL